MNGAPHLDAMYIIKVQKSIKFMLVLIPVIKFTTTNMAKKKIVKRQCETSRGY